MEDKTERCGTLHSGEQVRKGRKRIVTFAVHESGISRAEPLPDNETAAIAV